MGTGSSSDTCFPYGVINKYITWGGEETHQIQLKDLNPQYTYTFKVFGATVHSGSTRGTQIWTIEENRDTVLASNNTCNMAKLTNLVSDENGDLTINVKPIGGSAYINSIEIVEYTDSNISSSKNTGSYELNIYPNPVKNKLFVGGDNIPESITICTSDGKIVKHKKNQNEINVSSLRKGIYIVSIRMQDSIVSKKIFKE